MPHPDSLTAAELVRAIRGADKAAIVDARPFDRFTGQGVPEGLVSLAVEVELQPVEKSFTDTELKAIADQVVAAAAKVRAVLRGLGLRGDNLSAIRRIAFRFHN